MSNGYGTYRTTLRTDMQAYDAAPACLRWLMRNAVGKWASQPMVDRYWAVRRASGHDSALQAITRSITAREAEQTLSAYGPLHPEVRA